MSANIRRNRKMDRRLGANLRRLREQANMTKAGLAGRLNVTYQQIHKYEAGENRISAALLWQLAGIFSAPIYSFFE